MKTMEDIRRQGLEALARELGPVGMARFLQLFENGSGDYVQERHERHDREGQELTIPLGSEKPKVVSST